MREGKKSLRAFQHCPNRTIDRKSNLTCQKYPKGLGIDPEIFKTEFQMMSVANALGCLGCPFKNSIEPIETVTPVHLLRDTKPATEN